MALVPEEISTALRAGRVRDVEPTRERRLACHRRNP